MNIAETLGIVATSLGIIAVLGKWIILNPLKAFIKDQTYPIQPTANGGRSLPDIARTVDRIEKRLDEHINLHLKDEV
jgi:hypothetical protein